MIREKLIQLLNNSYSPYSKFRVSSICEMKDGKLFEGVNVENASYGATICAERVAILSATTKGYKKGDFHKLYVMTDNDKISTSCFMCRQVINEFFDTDNEIIFMNKLGDSKTVLVKDLCPFPFGEGDLK